MGPHGVESVPYGWIGPQYGWMGPHGAESVPYGWIGPQYGWIGPQEGPDVAVSLMPAFAAPVTIAALRRRPPKTDLILIPAPERLQLTHYEHWDGRLIDY